MKKISYVLGVAAFVCLSSFARELADDQLNFVIDIPVEFQDYAEGKTRSEILHSFILPLSGDEGNVVINIEGMDGTIGREPLSDNSVASIKQQLPSGSSAKVLSSTWNDFQVYGIEMIIPNEGINVISRSAQIPLANEAIQISVVGPGGADEQITEVFNHLLETLEGDSSWLTSSERAASGLAALKGLALPIGIGIVVGIIITNRRKKKKE